MADQTTLEQRVEALERTVAELQERLLRPVVQPKSVLNVVGSMKDEPFFDEVVAYGREHRRSDQPSEPDDEP